MAAPVHSTAIGLAPGRECENVTAACLRNTDVPPTWILDVPTADGMQYATTFDPDGTFVPVTAFISEPTTPHETHDLLDCFHQMRTACDIAEISKRLLANTSSLRNHIATSVTLVWLVVDFMDRNPAQDEWCTVQIFTPVFAAWGTTELIEDTPECYRRVAHTCCDIMLPPLGEGTRWAWRYMEIDAFAFFNQVSCEARLGALNKAGISRAFDPFRDTHALRLSIEHDMASKLFICYRKEKHIYCTFSYMAQAYTDGFYTFFMSSLLQIFVALEAAQYRVSYVHGDLFAHSIHMCDLRCNEETASLYVEFVRPHPLGSIYLPINAVSKSRVTIDTSSTSSRARDPSHPHAPELTFASATCPAGSTPMTTDVTTLASDLYATDSDASIDSITDLRVKIRKICDTADAQNPWYDVRKMLEAACAGESTPTDLLGMACFDTFRIRPDAPWTLLLGNANAAGE